MLLGALLAVVAPGAVVAHAELETSSPADGATVPSPFDGPIVLTFSAALADGSKADLIDSGGTTIASAAVDGPRAEMTIRLGEALAPGDYEIKWTTVAEDTDVARGTIALTVEPAVATASPSPDPSPSPEATASDPPASPTDVPSMVSPALILTPTESPATTADTDVILPIIVLLIVVATGAVYLLNRRNRPTSPG